MPAATTLVLKTGLTILSSTPVNGFMIALIHISKTSPKNPLMASSVCGLVGLFGMLVVELLDLELEVEVFGLDVYDAKGGKVVGVSCGVCGAVLGG